MKPIIMSQVIVLSLLLIASDLQAGNPNTILLANKTLTNELQNGNTDSTDVQKSDSANDSLYIPLNEFCYADNPRYLMDGQLPYRTTNLKTWPTIFFASGLTAAFIAQHIGQLHSIWQTFVPFRFAEDIKQDLGVDKMGHFYGCYMAAYGLSEFMMEAGMSWKAASTWGGLLGLSYSTYVEVLDGFGKQWGFSPSDFYSDVAGSMFFLGQHYFPILQNFTPKFIYIPNPWIGYNERIPHDMFIDDYSSQNFFMSVNVHNLLPVNLKEYWPAWLQLSFGYVVRNMLSPGDPAAQSIVNDPSKWGQYDVRDTEAWGSPRYVVALDYDLVKILPDGGSFWNWFRQSLNYFKLPSPAVEFSKSKTRFYLFYPFPL